MMIIALYRMSVTLHDLKELITISKHLCHMSVTLHDLKELITISKHQEIDSYLY